MAPHVPRRRPNRKTPSGTSRLKGARADLPDDDVELNSDDSFPASDAPSWTPVSRVGEPKHAPAFPGRNYTS